MPYRAFRITHNMMYLHLPTLRKILRTTFSERHFHPLHATYVVVLLTLFFVLRAVVWIARLVDRVAVPSYRNQAVDEPIYITGNPRSGTTFLHRLMGSDGQFTYTTLAETIFPAIVFYRLFAATRALDRRLGNPLARSVAWVGRTAFRGWEGIHKTRLEEAEEDEQLFIYALLSPVLALLFPFFDPLDAAAHVDDQPERVRQRLMAYYRDCLKRHLYATGPDKTLLTKNTTMTGRLQSTLDAFPDARIVHVVRHPYDAIPSFLSMYEPPWTTFVPQTQQDRRAHRRLAALYCQYYRDRLALRDQLPADRYVEVRYEELTAHPQATVERIYEAFDLPMSTAFSRTLREEAEKARQYSSSHDYSLADYGLSRAWIDEQLGDAVDAYGFTHAQR